MTRQTTKSMWTTYLVVLVLAGPVVFFWLGEEDQGWLGILKGIGGLLLLFLLILVALGVFTVALIIVRRLLQRREDYDFYLARKASGEDGTVLRRGNITFWLTHPADRFQVLEQQMETVRSRFEELIGQPTAVDQPVRLFCFTKKSQFHDYLRKSGFALSSLDALYCPDRCRRMVLHIETAPIRPVDYENLARLLFGYYFFEKHKGFLADLWLYTGVSRRLAARGVSGERDRLQRKMLAAEAGGRLLTAQQLFHTPPRRILALFRRSQVHENFVMLNQMITQAESVVEYLCGPGAPAERRDAFRAFLLEFGQRDVEACFTRRLGFGFEQLLRDWEEWLRGQEVGPHDPPPAPIVRALLDSTLPFVRDRDADAFERILAIRDMGTAGYTLGADALIEVLREEDGDLRATARWALESISGLAGGNHVDYWRNWWNSLPGDVMAAE